MGGTRMTDSPVPDGARSPGSKVQSIPLKEALALERGEGEPEAKGRNRPRSVVTREPGPDTQDSTKPQEPRYRRVLLKLSGEALAGDVGSGIDPAVVNAIADQVRDVVARGVQMAIVVGGGNIWRGIAASAQGMDRSTADYMGMLATVLNALALQDAMELRVMDSTAMALCMDNYLPLVVFNLQKRGNILRVVMGEHVGTKVSV